MPKWAHWYLRGLIDAAQAFRQGAPPESLVSVDKRNHTR